MSKFPPLFYSPDGAPVGANPFDSLFDDDEDNGSSAPPPAPTPVPSAAPTTAAPVSESSAATSTAPAPAPVSNGAPVIAPPRPTESRAPQPIPQTEPRNGQQTVAAPPPVAAPTPVTPTAPVSPEPTPAPPVAPPPSRSGNGSAPSASQAPAVTEVLSPPSQTPTVPPTPTRQTPPPSSSPSPQPPRNQTPPPSSAPPEPPRSEAPAEVPTEGRSGRRVEVNTGSQNTRTFEGMVDPENGTVLALWPGESKTIAFTANNPFQHQVTFEAKVEGADGFYNIDAGVHHVPQGGQARIEITFHASENALPEERWFQVQLVAGLRAQNQQAAGYHPDSRQPVDTSINDGQTVVRRWNLGLRVSVNPILKLSAPDGLTSSSGPRSPFVTWNLQVESVKKTEMEWRIAAKSRTRVPEGNSDVVFGAQPWEYHFSQEMSRFERVGPHDPQPQTITLRARRRGRWYWGWVENHELEVEAQPVTNPNNDNVGTNRLQLRARRWRLLPCDGAFFTPVLIFALLWLGPAPSELQVKNALPYTEQGLFVVEGVPKEEVQKLPGGLISRQGGASTKVAKPLPVELTWNNTWGAPLALSRSCASAACGGVEDYSSRLFDFSRSRTDVAIVGAEDYYNSYNYGIGRWIGGYTSTSRINLVAARTFGRFSVRDSDKSKIPLGTVEVDPETDHRILKLTVTVPRDGGKTLFFFNSSTAQSNYEVRYWVAQKPPYYSIGSIIPEGVSVLKDGPRGIRISFDGADNPNQIGEKLVLVTTDANAQVVEITLQTPAKAIDTETQGGAQ